MNRRVTQWMGLCVLVVSRAVAAGESWRVVEQPDLKVRRHVTTVNRKMGMRRDISAPTGERAMITRSTDGEKTGSKPETLIDMPADDWHPAFVLPCVALSNISSNHLAPMIKANRLILSVSLAAAFGGQARDQWTSAQANAWQAKHPWFAGCNFGPSTAVNQLEMWQAESWDTATIDRELGWAEDLGFNSVRVFLHHLLWEQDKEGLLKRMDEFLALADKHHIGVIFVPLDGVWDPFPKLGRQREPKPHLHNSGWMQSPGVELLKEPARHDELKPYIAGAISRFRDDRRVHAWDIFNEPDNMNRPAYARHEPTNKAELATALLKKTFAWAREANPSQPITSGVWLGTWGDPAKLSAMEKVMLDESDIITFHNYAKLDEIRECVQNLKRYNRPILCTEFMARPRGSTFDPILGYLKEQKVGAYNWGFVAGKTQTIYPWDSWTRTYTNEPPLWFHDIFRQNGAPYNKKETDHIMSVTGKSGK